jgi:hypothetical protein
MKLDLDRLLALAFLAFVVGKTTLEITHAITHTPQETISHVSKQHRL